VEARLAFIFPERKHSQVDFINTQIVKAHAALTVREEGQAMVEYGLILVLVSVVAIAALGIIGGDLHNAAGTGVFDRVAGSLT
jgi:Flp pilus assembly pilin Flp